MEPPNGPEIALVLPVAGPRAAWGRALRRVVDTGAGTAVRWVLHDESGAPDGGQRCARKVLERGGYRAVVGHLSGRGAAAALPLYREAGLPCLLPFTALPPATALASTANPSSAATPPPSRQGGSRPLALSWVPAATGQADALLTALDSFDPPGRVDRAGVGVLTDGSTYGRRLGRRLLDADSAHRPVRAVELAGQLPPGIGSVVVAARFHRAAELAKELRLAGFKGQLAFPDDCELADFDRLAGRAAAGALLARPTGGKAPRVRAALAALAAALTDRPALAGAELAAAVRERSALLLDAFGAPVADSWQVVRLT